MRLWRRHDDQITGRAWLSILWLHFGFGPNRWLERVHWGGRLIWFNKTALQIYRLQAALRECTKELRRAQLKGELP